MKHKLIAKAAAAGILGIAMFIASFALGVAIMFSLGWGVGWGVEALFLEDGIRVYGMTVPQIFGIVFIFVGLAKSSAS